MAKKDKKSFECNVCGHQSPKWNGRCLNCGSWNSYVETLSSGNNDKSLDGFIQDLDNSKPIPINEVQYSNAARIDSLNTELNRVLGGGFVPGSIVLIGGHPGVGKSTLLLQTVLAVKRSVLYVSGEESNQQIKMRAERIHSGEMSCTLYNATNIIDIIKATQEINPDLLVIDSIQTCRTPDLDSLPGSVAQIRACTQILQQYAKKTNTAVILIGHINKEGKIAGPMILEHIVDAVLLFEGDRKYQYRILRAAKNRFGSTDEMGIFDMTSKGLMAIENPSEMFLSDRNKGHIGQAIGTVQEGRRTIMAEVQSLINNAIFGTPQRSTTGFDIKRLHMLLAVMENKLGLYLGQKDVYLNIAGGLKIQETALDMGVCASIISAFHQFVIPADFCFIGECSLSGDFSNIAHIEQRILEADRMGYNKILIPKFKHSLKMDKLRTLENIQELENFLKHEL